MKNVCGSCGRGTQHIEGRCRNCGGPFSPRQDIYELWRRVQAHPDYVFGTIFVRGDFPNERVPEEFYEHHVSDRLAEVGNTLIYDACGQPEEE